MGVSRFDSDYLVDDDLKEKESRSLEYIMYRAVVGFIGNERVCCGRLPVQNQTIYETVHKVAQFVSIKIRGKGEFQ